MQTFLPYESFAESAAVLDTPRLGKQRVETLQILRALVLPTYAWQNHPATAMWRGFVPGLTAYGLAMVREWTARGYADSVRQQLLEFAPQVDGRSQQDLAAEGLLPAWIGDPALHESHRSRLIAKAPEVYRPLFDGTPEGIEYLWPPGPEAVAEPAGHGLWVLRAEAVEPWRRAGMVGLPVVGPRGRTTPAWRQQLRSFEEELLPGTVVAVLGDDEPALLHLAAVTGPVAAVTLDGVDHLGAAVVFEGSLERASLPVPAVLQNPRRLFHLRMIEPLAALRLDPEDSSA